MTAPRRIGAKHSATRGALLDAAQELMLDEGYAAVTSRRLAAKAGLKPQLVHYYFRTMDDLFVALVRRGAEQNLERHERALAAGQPLQALWALNTEPAAANLTIELFALSNHRKAIRAELASYAERFRGLQAEALTAVLDGSGIDPSVLAPEAAVFLVTAVSQVMVLEEALGMTTGHSQVRALVSQLLARYEATDVRGSATARGR